MQKNEVEDTRKVKESRSEWGKIVPVHTMMVVAEVYFHSFLTWTLYEGTWSASHLSPYCLAKNAGTHRIPARAGARVGLDVLEKNFAPNGNRTTDHWARSVVIMPCDPAGSLYKWVVTQPMPVS
jgi:hypothetical protein